MTVQTRGATSAAAHLREIGARASDVRPLARPIGKIVGDSNRRRFQTHGDGKWKPLAETTKERKGSDRILVDTGKLEKSMASPKVVKATRDEIAFGTDVEYAGFADAGTSRQPARPLSDLRPSEQKQISKLVEGFVAKGRK